MDIYTRRRLLYELTDTTHEIVTGWLTFVATLLPFPIIVISCCVTVYQLRSGASEIQNTEGGKMKRHATITIVILTGIYISCNAPICIWRILDMGEDWSTAATEFMFQEHENFELFYKFISFNSIVLNSLCNVVVYFCRLKGLRQYITNLFIKMRRAPPGVVQQTPVTRITHISEDAET